MTDFQIREAWSEFWGTDAWSYTLPCKARHWADDLLQELYGGHTMGDMGDSFRAYREHQRERKALLGVKCPRCIKEHPHRHPTILMPQQRCRWCGYRDTRPRVETQ